MADNNIEFDGIEGRDQIASMKTLRMQRSEGHLGGYILDGAAPGTWCPGVWDYAINTLGIRSVLDVGCGLGYAARYFRDKGCRVRAIDGSDSAARDNVVKECFVQHDFCSGPYLPEDRYDMINSFEFVEHVEERFSGNFLLTFLAATRYILLTYAGPGQSGFNHVNEQPEEYWVERLGYLGFQVDHATSKHLRKLTPDHPVVGKHFRNRGLLFRRA